jgi:hypothetical protein
MSDTPKSPKRRPLTPSKTSGERDPVTGELLPEYPIIGDIEVTVIERRDGRGTTCAVDCAAVPQTVPRCAADPEH